MADRRDTSFGLAALSGGVAVIAGAFAAHGLGASRAGELVRTAASYQAIHALAAMMAALTAERLGPLSRWAARLFLAGALLFSGSLYALALGAPPWIGVVTPLGGLGLIAGWALLAWAAWTIPAKSG